MHFVTTHQCTVYIYIYIYIYIYNIKTNTLSHRFQSTGTVYDMYDMYKILHLSRNIGLWLYNIFSYIIYVHTEYNKILETQLVFPIYAALWEGLLQKNGVFPIKQPIVRILFFNLAMT